MPPSREPTPHPADDRHPAPGQSFSLGELAGVSPRQNTPLPADTHTPGASESIFAPGAGVQRPSAPPSTSVPVSAFTSTQSSPAHAQAQVHEPSIGAAGDLTEELHEHLKLGARMLEALETQIERCQDAAPEIPDAAAIESAIDARVREAAAGLESDRRRLSESLRADIARAIEHGAKVIDERARRVERPAAEVDRIRSEIDQHVETVLSRIDLAAASGNADNDSSGASLGASPALIDADSQKAVVHAMQSAIKGAVARLDDHVAQRRRELESETRRLEAARKAAEESAARLEALHAEAPRHAADLHAAIDEGRVQADAARRAVTETESARGALETTARSATAATETIEHRGERIRITADEQVARIEAIESRISAGLARLEAAANRAEAIEDVCERLDAMLVTLEPWESLLCRSPRTPEGLPKVAVDLAAHLQGGIGRDVAALSTTMRQMSERLNGLGIVRQPTLNVSPSSAGAHTVIGPAPKSRPRSIAEVRPTGPGNTSKTGSPVTPGDLDATKTPERVN